MTTHRIAAIVLAAGASRRLGTAKQLLRKANGESLLVRIVRDAVDAGCDPVVVVLGAQADDVREVLAQEPAVCVYNPLWTDGMSSSIRAGIDHVASSACTAVLLLACDQPAVSASHLRALLEQHRMRGERVVSVYEGVHGIPAVWPRSDWSGLRALHGDRGAKSLLRGDEPAITLAQGALDLDTPEDVYLWRAADSDTD
jgi:CTP:molybdopterin cytidylyltransferase MocA